LAWVIAACQEEEIAFYNALANNESAVKSLAIKLKAYGHRTC